jgi:hypothetical protein
LQLDWKLTSLWLSRNLFLHQESTSILCCIFVSFIRSTMTLLTRLLTLKFKSKFTLDQVIVCLLNEQLLLHQSSSSLVIISHLKFHCFFFLSRFVQLPCDSRQEILLWIDRYRNSDWTSV